MTTNAVAIIEPTAALTKAEAKKLDQLEGVIHENMRSFLMNVGAALLEISRNKLYRELFPTFEEYMEQRLGVGANYGHKLVAAAEVTTNLKTLAEGCPLPTAERQVRDLADFPPEEQAAIWREACSRAGTGSVPSGRIVNEIAEERRAALEAAGTPTRKAKAKKAIAAPEPEPELDEEDDDEPNVSDDFFTPEEYLPAVRDVLGHIELDPASCDEANEVIQAERFFTIDDDGLAQEWDCETMYLNPPFSRGNVDRFVAKILAAYDNGEIRRSAILLVNANTSSKWFEPLFKFPCCFVKGRIKFRKPRAVQEAEAEKEQKTGKKPSQHGLSGCVFVYLGPNMWEFAERFREFGTIATELRVP